MARAVFRIERKFKLLVPVKKKNARRKAHHRDRRGHGDDAPHPQRAPQFCTRSRLASRLRVRQSKMLLRRDVAQHRRAVPADHRRHRARDVIVARRDVNHQRAQRVKTGLRGTIPFFFYLQLDLVHRNVPGTFDHHCTCVPRPSSSVAPSTFNSANCASVARIGEASGRNPSPREKLTSSS